MQVTQGLARYGATITAVTLKVYHQSAWHGYHHGAVCLFSLMPALQRLELLCPGTFLDASSDLARLDFLPHLRVLTLRDLHCSSPWQAASLSVLGTLKNLEFLSIEITLSSQDLKILPPTLTSLTRLTHLDMHCWNNYIDCKDLGCIIGQLTSLEEVWLDCMHLCIPPELSGLPNLKSAYLGGRDNQPPDGPECTYFEEGALQACPSLTWLLLSTFAGDVVCSARSLFQCISALTSLQRLNLHGTILHMWATLGDGLPSQIVNLALVDCWLDKLPPCLVNHQGLISLDLRGSEITDLSAGPYLEHLRALDVSRTTLQHVPVALMEAASLEELVWDEMRNDDDDDPLIPVQPQIPAICRVSKVKRSRYWPGDSGYPEGMNMWYRDDLGNLLNFQDC